MITLPLTPAGTTRPENQMRFGPGTHAVKIGSIKLTKNHENLIVEYLSPDESFFFEDWMRFGSEAQGKRILAFIRHLHELAGLPIPASVTFDESQLKGAACTITLVENISAKDGKTYTNMSGFPCAITATGEEAPF